MRSKSVPSFLKVVFLGFFSVCLLNPCVRATSPTANDDFVVIQEDVSVNVDVLENDYDYDGDAVTLHSITYSPRNGTATINGNTVVYLPKADFNGADEFEYSITDGVRHYDTAWVRITVIAVRDAPRPLPDEFTIAADKELYADVLANDSDPDGDFIYVSRIVRFPSFGTASIQPNGILRYKFRFNPSLPFFYGNEDVFTYRVTDSTGLTNDAEVRIRILPPESPTFDADGDLLPDLWELEHFFNPLLTAEPDRDTDGDGLTDYYEYLAGTDPLLHNPAELSADPDQDDLSNIQEQQFGTHPQRADTDDNGILDGAEVAAGSDPTDSLSPYRPACISFTEPGGLVAVPQNSALSEDQQKRFQLQNWTIESWVKLSALPSAKDSEVTVAGFLIQEQGHFNYRIGIDENNHPFAAFHTDTLSSREMRAVATTALEKNKWYHLIARYDGFVLTLFVDGYPVAVAVVQSRCATGNGEFVVGNNLVGDVDEVRLWNTPLNSFESPTKPLILPQENLTAYFRFDDHGVTAEDFTNRNVPEFAAELRGNAEFTLACDPSSFKWDSPMNPDLDDDGILDCWEAKYTSVFFGDVLGLDPDADLDGDGLTNLDEFYLNQWYGVELSPLQYDSDGDGISDGEQDSDGDGLSNAREIEFSTLVPENDSDDDGMTNLEELECGFDPLDSLSKQNSGDWVLVNSGSVSDSNYAEIKSNTKHALEVFTISAWVRTSDDNGIIIVRGTSEQINYKLYVHDGLAAIRFNSTSGIQYSLAGDEAINDNCWHHVAAIVDPVNYRFELYVDGWLCDEMILYEFPVTANADIRLLNGFTLSEEENLTGAIDEVGIYAYGLQADAILELCEVRQHRGHLDPDVVHLPFDDGGVHAEDFTERLDWQFAAFLYGDLQMLLRDDGWLFPVEVENGQVSRVIFGMQSGADDLYDGEYDWLAPPYEDGQCVLSFLTDAGTALIRDVHDFNVDAGDWCLKVRNPVGKDCYLRWDSDSGLARSLCLIETDFQGHPLAGAKWLSFDSEQSLKVEGGNTVRTHYYKIRYRLRFDLKLYQGWNLISIPINPVSNAVADIFVPKAPTVVWGWDGTGYVQAQTVQPINGYWVYWQELETCFPVYGTVAQVFGAEFLPGWNLIGPVDEPPFANLSLPLFTTPANAVEYPIWKYEPSEQSYRPASVLTSGMGYWLRTNSHADISLRP